METLSKLKLRMSSLFNTRSEGVKLASDVRLILFVLFFTSKKSLIMKKYVLIFWAFISLPTFSFSQGCPTENIKIKEGDSYFILHLGFTNKDSYGFGEVRQEDITLFISKNLIKRTLKNSYLGEGLWIHGDYKYKGKEFAHGGWKQRDLFKNAILQENSDLKYPENGVITTNFSSKSCITNVLERIVQNLNPGHIVLIEEFTYEENDKWNTFSTVESPEVTAFVKSYNN